MKLLMEVLPLSGCAMATARVYSWSFSYLGTDFFSGWKFWTARDPSGGAVKYVDFTEAAQAGMINATATRIYLGVDMGVVASGANRRSVRIESRATFNHGLFVASLDHIPTGCGLWPAFWMYGEDAAHIWPKWGEYDVIEGTHRSTRVMTSLHTGPECDQSRLQKDLGVNWMTGPSGGPADNCNVAAHDQFHNQGCSQRGPDGTLGGEFNARGGGTYAAEWDPSAKHIRTWFWPRGLEPLDIAQRRPDPGYWGLPYSYFSLDPSVCSPGHFANMRLVFDITFCGELAGPTLARECPELGAKPNCAEFVRRHPEQLRDAYWSIRALDVYQRAAFPGARQAPPVPPEAERPKGRAPASAWLQRTELALLAVVLLVLLGVGSSGLLRWKLRGTRCPAFYERCLTEAGCDLGDEERQTGFTLDHVWGDEHVQLPPGRPALALHEQHARGARDRGDGQKAAVDQTQRVVSL